jgi:hypothetical protein
VAGSKSREPLSRFDLFSRIASLSCATAKVTHKKATLMLHQRRPRPVPSLSPCPPTSSRTDETAHNAEDGKRCRVRGLSTIWVLLARYAHSRQTS